VGPLSNGNTSLLLDMAKAGDLPWDLILGSDVTRAYKPTMEAYLRPAAVLGLEPGEIMLAAAHEADLAAARKAGLAAAFISRPLERGPGIPWARHCHPPVGPVRIVHYRTRRPVVIRAAPKSPDTAAPCDLIQRNGTRPWVRATCVRIRNDRTVAADRADLPA